MGLGTPLPSSSFRRSGGMSRPSVLKGGSGSRLYDETLQIIPPSGNPYATGKSGGGSGGGGTSGGGAPRMSNGLHNDGSLANGETPRLTSGGYYTQGYGPNGPIGGNNPSMDMAMQYFTGLAGTDYAQLGLSDAQLATQQAKLNAGYNLTSKYANQDLGFGNQRLDLQQQGVGVERGANMRQIEYYAKLMGMNTADLARRMGYVDEAQGLAYKSFGRENQYIDQQHGFVGRQLSNANLGFDYSTASVLQAGQTGLRDQRDAAAAGGSYATAGNRDRLSDVRGTQAQGLGQIDVGRKGARLDYDTSKAGLKNQRGDLKDQLSEQLLGFKSQRGELKSDYGRDQLSLKEQQAKLNDSNKMLDIKSSEIGLSRRELSSSIQRQLEKAGLDRTFGVQDVMAALQSNDIQRISLAENIIRQATANRQFFSAYANTGR